jgi:GH15 family glucan-1,4-alpha-glucosidase
VLLEWPGFEGDGPVRVGNAAATHQQHDVFGEMVLALTPLFLDPRFSEHVTEPVLDLVTRLARKAVAVAGTPDTGIWEYRLEPRPQTFSSLMCWAAADRMRLIAMRHRPSVVAEFSEGAARIKNELLTRAIDPRRGCLASDYGGNEVDAALLQAVPLRLLSPDDPRIHATIDAVQRDLGLGNWLRRYRTNDGLGEHDSAFMVCTFWLAEALAGIERTAEARSVLARLRDVQSPLGLLSEDIDPPSGTMRGNFPQTYSHVGVIRAAFAASPRLWEYGP